MGEIPTFYIDSANRKLVEGKTFEITHVGNRSLGWMLTINSVKIRMAQNQATFKIVDPMSGLEEDVALFNGPDGNLVPRAHNGRRFTDALLSLGDCKNCKLID